MPPQLAFEIEFARALRFVQAHASWTFHKRLLFENTTHSLIDSVVFTMMTSLQLKTVLSPEGTPEGSPEGSPFIPGRHSKMIFTLFVLFPEIEMLR